jgi:8-oxo-dGTP pyrophosphatase MutT (NUDIX family)
MLEAAVVVPIVRRDEPAMVFVRRAAHLRRNPGEIAFPGGLIDAADPDARSAALREFEEELGVPRAAVRIVDRLEDVTTLALSVVIAPFVGLLDAPPAYACDARETESVHEIPLGAVYQPGALHEGFEAVFRDGIAYDVKSWLFDYDDIHVWGATARILHAFTSRYSLAEALAFTH